MKEKEFAKLNKLFKSFQKEKLKNRKRFSLKDLENFLIKKLKGVSAYQNLGGYQSLYQLLQVKIKQEEIVAIKSSPYNGRKPPLKTRWQLVTTIPRGWEERLIFMLSHRLDISYYLKRPQMQTKEVAAMIQSIDRFLAEKNKREWASREERSLELFADEKFLQSSEGKRLLTRLKLSLADIKAEKFSQMFVYWSQRGLHIEKVLILENHSAFIACKRAIEAGYSICSFVADTIIYGQGKHIVDSFKFLEEIADIDQVIIKYAGDIDPEGLAIYSKLKDDYPGFDLELHLKYYQQMVERGGKGYSISKKQIKQEKVLKKVRKELITKGEKKLADKLQNFWQDNLRIPQEVINFEVLKNNTENN